MAKIIPENTGGFIPVLSVLLSISAILTSFFGIYLGFYDALSGIIINIADRFIVRGKKFNNFLPYLLHLLRSRFFGDGLLPMCLQWHYSNGLWEPLD